MAKKIELPRKHVSKKLTPEQEKIVHEIQQTMHKKQGERNVTWLEAKHYYFENQEMCDAQHEVMLQTQTAEQVTGADTDDMMAVAADALKRKGIEKQLSKAATEIVKEQTKRKLLKLRETKLGVTMVLSLDDCKKMGFTGDELTGEVIDQVREKLGLDPRGRRASK